MRTFLGALLFTAGCGGPTSPALPLAATAVASSAAPARATAPTPPSPEPASVVPPPPTLDDLAAAKATVFWRVGDACLAWRLAPGVARRTVEVDGVPATMSYRVTRSPDGVEVDAPALAIDAEVDRSVSRPCGEQGKTAWFRDEASCREASSHLVAVKGCASAFGDVSDETLRALRGRRSEAPARLATLLKNRRAVFFAFPAPNPPSCDRFELRKASRAKGRLLRRLKDNTYFAVNYVVEGDTVTLSGAGTAGPAGFGLGCSAAHRVNDAENDSVTIGPYRWFFSKASCEDALTRGAMGAGWPSC